MTIYVVMFYLRRRSVSYKTIKFVEICCEVSCVQSHALKIESQALFLLFRHMMLLFSSRALQQAMPE